MTKIEIADRLYTLIENIGERSEPYRAGTVINPIPYSDTIFNKENADCRLRASAVLALIFAEVHPI